MIKISDLASLIGVSIVTLRRWEKQGKLVPAFRTLGNRRRYNKEDVNLVQKNKVLQAELVGVRGSKSSSLKRGQFLDKKINKIFNSDLNGAFNILKLGGAELQFVPESLYKLNNPIKIKKINEFPSFLKKEIVKQRDFGLINHLNPKNAVKKEVKKS